MKKYIPILLICLVFSGVIFIATKKSPKESPTAWLSIDWRADYRAMTKAQFIERWHIVFWNAVKKHCDEDLQCAWQGEHGQVGSFSDFYDAAGCSADTEFFPHFAAPGIDCDYELRPLNREGGVSWQ